MVYYVELIFCFLLITGLFVILTNNPVHAILGLVLIFFLGSCFSVILGVEFLAILILIVYVGAISVLFLFVVMLLNVRVIELNSSLVRYWWLGVLYSLFFLFILYFGILPVKSSFNLEGLTYVDLLSQNPSWSAAAQLGELLFVYYPHLLMFSALILLVAIVSPVVLSFVKFSKNYEHDKLNGSKKQVIFLQTLRLSVDKNF